MRLSRNWPSSFSTAKMNVQTSPTGEERPPQSTGASSLLRNIAVFLCTDPSLFFPLSSLLSLGKCWNIK